ncbi:unnamed protein product [Closterium sp. Naga37s-1]|nr:unnamed protein product [Closterium sp. Naga37s-1]
MPNRSISWPTLTIHAFPQLSKYQDPACFTYNLNHVVLLVGYRLVGKNSRFPHMAPPFWIIRNSWGPDWGDGGHMHMDIHGGDGVCGINSLPGLYPVVREDACKAAKRNPCAVGTCINDGAGSYSCVCPPGFRQGTTIDGTFSCARVCIRNTLLCKGSGTKACVSYTYTSDLTLPPLFLLIARVHVQFHSLSFRSSLKSSCPSTPAWVHAVSLMPLMPLWVHAMSLILHPRCVQSSVSCGDPIPPSTVLKVASPASLIPCSVFYTTQQGDTCAAVAEYFQMDSSCPSDTCTAAFQALNPSLDCN